MSPDEIDNLAEQIADVMRDGGSALAVQQKASEIVADVFNKGYEMGRDDS